MIFTVQAGANFVNTATSTPNFADLKPLREVFGRRVRQNAPLARYTAAQIGGPALALLEVKTAEELAIAVRALWKIGIPWLIIGGGSNILVSDRGVAGVVLLNRARKIEFAPEGQPPVVWAESGANFGLVARRAASLGLSGLEWAAGIPGTVGGAVVGNAGAHGGDMAGNLLVADILQQGSRPAEAQVEKWSAANMEFSYRSSLLKRQRGKVVVLRAMLVLAQSTPAEVQQKMDSFASYRRRTQPPGASLGSMFKNPGGDYAGRLIDAAGLKGLRIGQAQISPRHANFFVNLGQAAAQDVFQLIQTAQARVAEKFGVKLELEIELVGEWGGLNQAGNQGKG